MIAVPESKFPVVLAGFCAFLSLFATQPLLPDLALQFGASKVAVSLTVTSATLGVALAAPLAGTVADRFGRWRVIVMSAWLLAVASLLASTAQTLPALVGWRFVQGVVTPGVFAVTVAYIQEEWSSGGAGSATAAYVAGTILGGFCSRMISGTVASYARWQTAFVVLGLLGMAGAACLTRWLPRERHPAHRGPDSSFFGPALDHLRNRRLLGTYAVGFCLLFCLLGIFTFITFYLAAPPFGMSPAQIGSLFFVYLFSAAIIPSAGRLSDHYGARHTVLWALLGSAAGVLLTLSSNLYLVVSGLALACTGTFIAQSCSSSFIGSAATHNRALAVGLYVTSYYAGGSVGGTLPGLIWPFAGWPGCVFLFVVIQLITVALTWNFWKPVPAHSSR